MAGGEGEGEVNWEEDEAKPPCVSKSPEGQLALLLFVLALPLHAQTGQPILLPPEAQVEDYNWRRLQLHDAVRLRELAYRVRALQDQQHIQTEEIARLQARPPAQVYVTPPPPVATRPPQPPKRPVLGYRLRPGGVWPGPTEPIYATEPDPHARLLDLTREHDARMREIDARYNYR